MGTSESVKTLGETDTRSKTTCYDDGSTYEGEMTGRQRNGFGTLTMANGTTYKGQWVFDDKQGRGKQITKEGDEYDGEFFEDKFHGFGTFERRSSAEPSKYTGQWKEGHINGEGTETWADGKEYAGQFEKQRGKHVTGTFTWPNNASYKVSFKNNNLDGYGIYKWEKGTDLRRPMERRPDAW